MSRVAILICSCDYYSECWEPIICSFDKFWPDCEYDKLIVSNHKNEIIPGAKLVMVGDHKGWASDTLKAVELTDYDYYIYFQEDYWINRRVDNQAIKQHIKHCEANGVEYLKIWQDLIKRDKFRIGNSDYCKNPLDQRYAINTAVAIWRRDLFPKVCLPGDTGWDFEYKIVDYIKENHIEIKSEVLHSSVAISKGITMIPGNGIQRGKWTRAVVKFLKENGFDDLIDKRKTQGPIYGWVACKMNYRNIFTYYSIAAILHLLKKLKID